MKKIFAQLALLLTLCTGFSWSAGEPMSLVHFDDVEKRVYTSKPPLNQDIVDYFRGLTDPRVLGQQKSLTCLELAEVLCVNGHDVSFIVERGIISEGYNKEFMHILERLKLPLSQIKEKWYDAADETLAPETLEENIRQMARRVLVPLKLKKTSNIMDYIHFLTQGRKSNMICLDQKLRLEEGTIQHFVKAFKKGTKVDSVDLLRNPHSWPNSPAR